MTQGSSTIQNKKPLHRPHLNTYQEQQLHRV